MNKRSIGEGRWLSMAGVTWVLESLLLLNSGGFVEELLDNARKQTQPRRWPWQQKTLRDRLNDYGEDVSEYAKLQGDALLKIVQQQSRPRRWPWQQKTIRDLLDERTEEFAELAAARSAVLAQTVAQRRDELLEVVRKQTQPRRWLWQQKTARDRLNERSAQFASVAAERSAQLAALAAARRDALVSAARRQSQPRRWPWQQKTAYDRALEQRNALAKSAGEQYGAASERAKDLADRSGTALRKSANSASGYAQQAKDVVPGVLGAAGVATTAATALLKDNAKSLGESMNLSTNSAGSSLKNTAKSVGSSISSTAEDAADAVQSAVNKPVKVVNSGVKATKRTARWSRRVFRTAMWAGLAGIVIGMLAAPESGQEMRKHLQAAFDQLSRSMQGGGGSSTSTQA